MADIVQKSWDQRQWMPTETAGLEYSGLRAHASGGATFFLRFASGIRARPHNHPEGEELYVVCLLTALVFHHDLGDKAERTLFFKDLALAGGLLAMAAAAAQKRRVDEALAD